jgi:hypothetical protein
LFIVDIGRVNGWRIIVRKLEYRKYQPRRFIQSIVSPMPIREICRSWATANLSRSRPNCL